MSSKSAATVEGAYREFDAEVLYFGHCCCEPTDDATTRRIRE
jgi:hypothetical protein